MMDQEILKPFDEDLEDGELSDSDEGYTPLPRPGTTTTSISGVDPIESTIPPQITTNVPIKMEEAIEDSVSDFGPTDSSTSDSDDCLNKLGEAGENSKKSRKKKTKRTVLLRVKADNDFQEKKARFKKYDIWASSLQEETLTENMRGIGVRHDLRSDRNVENYDYTLKYRLNGENSLKRRLSTSSDEHSENDFHQQAKRSRAGGIKSRLGQRSHRPSESSSDYNSNEPRLILDLDEPIIGRPPQDIAREMANKLFEEKDELLLRVVETIGPDMAVEIFKEAQRIERDGGMMILNGKRRRTPGGVFLFLLKNHERITPDEHKLIFYDERKTAIRTQKEVQALKRHRKVEELKKRLSAKEKNLPALTSRKELYLGSELKAELKSTLSNPPPSPVGQEHSPEYKSHAINEVCGEPSPEKPSTSKDVPIEPELLSYDDDFLDVNCGDMDFF
ncbi:phosphorylated adapter RNA export protein [Episyrphus balteatus]|uniref:phosphorylated adapter RNA export protein n=1 Tax=Episyrphus balteatus TaxID=286459 RepID=UPI0024865714|nr:phosphorylated adapter RNA export protein [Episyrphus balteatus]